jgi:hypothetical protein
MAHHDADDASTAIGRKVFLITVVSALAFGLAAYLLVSRTG